MCGFCPPSRIYIFIPSCIYNNIYMLLLTHLEYYFPFLYWISHAVTLPFTKHTKSTKNTHTDTQPTIYIIWYIVCICKYITYIQRVCYLVLYHIVLILLLLVLVYTSILLLVYSIYIIKKFYRWILRLDITILAIKY